MKVIEPGLSQAPVTGGSGPPPARNAARPRQVSTEALSSLVRPGELVYVPGASGAPQAFMSSLLANTGHQKNLRLLTSYVPGINTIDMSTMDASACVTGLFMHAGLQAAQRSGRYRCLPLSYAGFVRHVLDRVDPDLAVVQLAPPDAEGNCSLGPAVEFMPTILKKTSRVLGLINHQTPRIRGAASIPYARLDHVCEVDTPLPIYDTQSSPVTEAIARHIAPLVPDGSSLQIGLGKVPMALSRLLCDRRMLRLHSGMLSDGLLDLANAGALDPDFLHTTCAIVGSTALYRQMADFTQVRVLGCEFTHDPRVLLELDNFVSVNSALEVDLFGQCNLEHADGHAISGAGGAPDFARAARLSSGGRSIVALNATHHGGKGTRIVPCLGERAITSISRIDVDHVVTEYGVASLCGASVHERAHAIIAVAAPEFREDLARAWSAIAARL
ncbi:MAG: acetyl-CoA hydrolase/transferase C-terminal domain-containing protein [Pseudomonadota bacterium]